MQPKRSYQQMRMSRRMTGAKAVGYMKPDIDPNTRLYIPFNEGVGSVAKDYSQYCNHAVLTDVLWGIGIGGNTGVFNGTSSFGNCGNDASLNITKAISIVVQPKRNDVLINQRIIEKVTGTAHFIRTTSSARISCGVYTDSGATFVTSTTATLEVGERYRITHTYDSVTGINIVYVDGNQIDLDISDAVDKTISVSLANLHIGGIPSNEFNGSLDEARIKALAESAAQIAADNYEVCN